MGCFGIGGGFIWQGERQPESCSCRGFQTPWAPHFALPISSRETLQTHLGLAGELVKKKKKKKKKRQILLLISFLKRVTVLNLEARGYFKSVLIFRLAPPPPHEWSPSMVSQWAVELSLPAGPSLDRQAGVFTAPLSFPAPLLPETLFVFLHSN